MKHKFEIETFVNSESSRFPDRLSFDHGNLYISNMRGFYHGAGYRLGEQDAKKLRDALDEFFGLEKKK